MRNFIILLGVFAVLGVGYWAYQNSAKLGLDLSAPQIQDKPIDLAIKPYLTTYIIPDIYPQSRVFCSYHTYGTQKDNELNYTYAYLWVYCEEYYMENGQLSMGQGISYPIKLTVEEIGGKLDVQSHEEPEDGAGYAQSIKTMFPEKYAEAAISGYDVKRFNPNPEEQARMYFSLN